MTLELSTAGESHGPALVGDPDRPPGRVDARPGGHSGRSRAQAGGLRQEPSPADRDRSGRGSGRAPARTHARHAARAGRAEPRSQELDVGDESLGSRGGGDWQGQGGGHAPAPRACRSRRGHEVRARRCAKRARARERAPYGGDRRGGRGRESSPARDRRHRKRLCGRCGRRRERGGDPRGDRRGPRRARHARWARRGSGAAEFRPDSAPTRRRKSASTRALPGLSSGRRR